MASQKTIFITTTGTGIFNVPLDFGSLVSVEAIGGGGNGNSGINGAAGGGGAYAYSNALTALRAGGQAFYQVGTTAQDSWFNTTSAAAPTLSTEGVLAKAGISSSGTTGAAGGSAASCVGTITYSGGAGGSRLGSGNYAGGGGAAGPNGAGWKGGDVAVGGTFNGGGGGAGGGSGSAGVDGNTIKNGNGGNGPLGTGGGVSNGGAGTAGTGGGGAATNGASSTGGAGATYNYWTQSSNSATAGPGGGGGGTNGSGSTGGAGALYGGGGGSAQVNAGAGAQGIIVFTYYVNYEGSGYTFPILNSTGTASTTSADFQDMFVRKELFFNSGLYAWGYDFQGQLGDGVSGNVAKSSPIQIGLLRNWKQVSGGGTSGTGGFSAAVKYDGSLWMWGYNTGGALGDGTVISKSSPIQIGSLNNWKQVIAGARGMSAIKTDGTLWVWGFNASGQLGQGTATNSSFSSPIQVGLLTNWKQLSRGGGVSVEQWLSIKTDGTLWACGDNTSGVLGDGTIVAKSSPVQIGSLNSWKQISVGSLHSMGIMNDGTLWGWGSNSSGSLGVGNTTAYSSPIQVGSLANWKQISCGLNVSFGIKTDGTLWGWGVNTNGQIGDSTAVSKSSPIQVGLLNNWKYISTGNQSNAVHAIKTDGTLWAWGGASQGSMGDGLNSARSSPIQIGVFTNWKTVNDANAGTTLAILNTD